MLNTGSPTHWLAGFYFGAGLVLIFMVRRLTEAQMEAAVRAAPDKAEAPKPVTAQPLTP